MASLSDSVGDYCGSEHFMFLDSAVKGHAEALLAAWCEDVGEDTSSESFARALRNVGRLDVPVAARKAFPGVLTAFFEYVARSGAVPHGDELAQTVRNVTARYVDSFREDGSVRGETVKRVLKRVGRNDACPCGSGKKYKRCCFPAFG